MSQSIPLAATPKQRSRALRDITALAVIALPALCAGDLLTAWRTSPADAGGWAALLVWLSPLAVHHARRERQWLAQTEQILLAASAVLLTVAGLAARLNVLEHAGLILAMTSLMPWRRANLIWAASALAWTPAFGWLTLGVLPAPILAWRLLIAVTGSAVMLFHLAPLRETKTKITDSRMGVWLLGAGLIALLGLAAVWRLAPVSGAEHRLLNLPISGEDFRSWSVPLGSGERRMLGEGLAVRRMYQTGDLRFLVSVVDGAQNRHAVHDPRYCFAGAGYAVLRGESIPVAGGSARLMRVAHKDNLSSILYWFSDGRVRHASMTHYWWDTTLRRITLGASGEEPVLVIVQCEGDNDPQRLVNACQPLFEI